MSTVKAERQSNIELLRILAIMGVIVLHYNNPVIGGGIRYAEEGSANFYILYFLESLFICGVDLFMLISGYFLCKSNKRNLWKPVELIAQVMMFKVGIYFAKIVLGSTVFSANTMMTTLIPSNYFVILYCAVFMVSPFINVLISHLSEKSFKTMILLLLLIFSIYPTIVDVLGEIRGEQFIGLSSIGMYGSQWGYSIVNFMLMYLLGAYLKKGNSKVQNCSTLKLVIGILICIAIMMVWARMNDKVGYLTERSAWEYCNPVVITEAILIFILFSRIKLGVNIVINTLSESVFTVFLFHSVFIPYLWIEKIVKGNTFIMILHILGCMISIYLICWCVHKVYHLVMDPIFKRLSAKYPKFMIVIDR